MENLNVDELIRHTVHREMLGEKNEQSNEVSSLKEKLNEIKKVLPVLFVVVMNGDIEEKHVIDGWSSVIIYRSLGIKTILGLSVDLENPEELPYLLADLHTTYHDSPEEDFMKFTYFYDILSVGRGYRSDLINDNE